MGIIPTGFSPVGIIVIMPRLSPLTIAVLIMSGAAPVPVPVSVISPGATDIAPIVISVAPANFATMPLVASIVATVVTSIVASLSIMVISAIIVPAVTSSAMFKAFSPSIIP
uniref:Uncharacterized protein n=1 Tax=Chrysotila carterae TaxID=13221 RepID=A0A7S4EW62_CHRCT